MTVYVYIRNGVVGDRVQVPPASVFSQEYAAQFLEAPDDVQWGWLYDGQYFAPPPASPEPVPSSCSRGQGRLALLEAGYLDDVEAAIAAIPDGYERRKAQIEYEREQWERSNAFLQSMWAALGGTPEQLDDLFRLAVTL